MSKYTFMQNFIKLSAVVNDFKLTEKQTENVVKMVKTIPASLLLTITT